MSDEVNYEIIEIPTYVCYVNVFPGGNVEVYLEKWPSCWYRFWTWVFFGWKFERLADAN